MHDSTCESSEEVGSEAAVEYDEENPDYESDEYQLVMDFISIRKIVMLEKSNSIFVQWSFCWKLFEKSFYMHANSINFLR